MHRRFGGRASVLLTSVIGLALVAGCVSTSGTDDQALIDETRLTDGFVGVVDDPGEPVSGGSASFASFSEPSGLDPATTIAASTTGGVELLNIYDSLMRYDADQQTEVPQLAESLVSDDDRVWTLTLRDGVRFSDGAVLDAEAVVRSQERFAAAGGPDAVVWNDNVAEVVPSGVDTVVYELERPWPEFPNVLTTGAGMIVAPDAQAPETGYSPPGAGPFTLADWQSGVAVTLEAREDYWDGRPFLDTVTVAYLDKTDVAKDTFRNGELDVVYLRNPNDIRQVTEEGYPGYVGMAAVANVTIINASPGRPGSDVRVRKAIQLALDSEALYDRAFGTTLYSGRELFGEYSRWHTDQKAAAPDPERARQLVDQARADGFDGRLLYDGGPNETTRQQALALQAQLEAVGFDVDIRSQSAGADHVRAVAADQDYDIAEWGVNLRDPDPYVKMAAAMRTGGTQVYGMHTSDEMDALIDDFQSADDEGKRDVMESLQAVVNDQAPFVTHGFYPEYLAMQPDLHGVIGSSNSMISFAKGWKS